MTSSPTFPLAALAGNHQNPTASEQESQAVPSFQSKGWQFVKASDC